MTTQQPSPDAQSQSSAAPHQRRWGKLVFGVLFVVAAAWLVFHQRTHTRLGDWDKDLAVALKQAAKESRQVVAVIYGSPQDYTFERLQEILIKPGNKKAMDEANVIRVAVSLSRDDPLAIQYNVRDYPTTLLIGPDGKLITAWVGYIGETEFRSDFLKGKPQPRH